MRVSLVNGSRGNEGALTGEARFAKVIVFVCPTGGNRWSAGARGSAAALKYTRMAIIDLYSKRQKRVRGEFPDIYQYDSMSPAFRTQAAQVIKDLFGDPARDLRNACSTKFTMR
jgi:hypothetical protein